MEARVPSIDPMTEAAYLGRQARPHWPDTVARLQAASAEVLTRPDVERDVAYGPHERQRFDFVPATGPARAVLIYLHPGYWQARDKATFACLAPTFAALGCDVVTANYPLCPSVTLSDLTEAVRALVPVVAAACEARHGRRLPIVAAGHSAGGHLAVELAMTDWSARGLSGRPVTGVIALSGVFDLVPLVVTSLNVALGLDAETALAASPVRRVGRIGSAAVFAVGGGETDAFVAQTWTMHDAWRTAGHVSRMEIVGDDDHFSLLDTLMDPSSGLHAAIADLIDRAAR